MDKDSVIVLSGGMDSTTMLYEFKDRIALAVTFNYGSNHNAREIECARYNCRILGIELLVIDLPFIGTLFNSSLLSGADEIPLGNYDDQNMRSTVVPFRNGIMLSIAAGIAEDRGLRHLMIANHGGDHAIYPDCRPAFVHAMSQAVSAGTYNGVDIVAPYTDISKTDIARRGFALGVDYSHTYSCYKGSHIHCGLCGTCRERRQAFAEAGIPDPTEYEFSQKNIKNILFDLGGVIMDINKQNCIAAFRKLGLKNAESYFGDFIQQGPFMMIERGDISPERFHQILHADLPAGVSDSDIDRAFCQFLVGIPLHRLRALRLLARKFNICLLSNTNPIMWNSKIKNEFLKDGLSIDDYFPGGIVTSFKANALKPEDKIFLYAIENLGLQPSQTLFVDDSEANLQAARQLGFKTLHIDHGQDFTNILTDNE